MQCQHQCTGDHLGPHDLLGLKVVVGCDEGGICPDPRQSPPDHHTCMSMEKGEEDWISQDREAYHAGDTDKVNHTYSYASSMNYIE